MIKLFHVFDKTLGMDFSGEDGHNRLKILMEDSLSEIDLDDLPCPSCGYRPVQWKHRYTRTSMFIAKVVLTVQEAAEELGISKPKVYELVRAGKFHTVNIGKKILISRQSMLDWIKKGDSYYGKEAC